MTEETNSVHRIFVGNVLRNVPLEYQEEMSLNRLLKWIVLFQNRLVRLRILLLSCYVTGLQITVPAVPEIESLQSNYLQQNVYQLRKFHPAFLFFLFLYDADLVAYNRQVDCSNFISRSQVSF
jgi:hypothetical protein